MNERIKQLRKYLGLNQTEFGEKIGVKQTSIAGYETGARYPIDAVIRSICRTFGVSELWLRTGEGDMLPKMTRAQEIAAYANAMMDDSPGSARSIIISYIMSLDVEDWEAISGIIKKHGLPGQNHNAESSRRG